MTEIERKFVVERRPEALDRVPGERIEQGYVAIDVAAEVRLRRRGDDITLTVKSAPGLTRTEVELPVDEASFSALWPLTEGRRVIKTRHAFGHDGALIEVDVYEEGLRGLMTAEVEFASEAAAGAFHAPAWLGREVTGDARYANQRLATAGAPGGDAMPAAGRFPSFVDELPLTREALAFAATRHGGQHRDVDAAPFILHPLEVAQLVRGRGYPDHVVAAAVLHDVVEDTDVELAELGRRFGPAVAALVGAVSEPSPGGDYAERKARLRGAVAAAEGDAVAIFAADKIAKTHELRIALARDRRHEPSPEKLDHYRASLAVVESRLGHHPLALQLRFELEALALLPPSGGARRLRRAGATPRPAT